MRFFLFEVCLLACLPAAQAANTASISGVNNGLSASINTDGQYRVAATLSGTNWIFGGSVPKPVTDFSNYRGNDGIGGYSELRFRYIDGTPREASIRIYDLKPVVLFGLQYLADSDNSGPFPNFTTFPKNLSELAYNGTFGVYRFNSYPGDSPWVMFDQDANALILSPASNFLIAQMKNNSGASWSSGILSSIAKLPSSFQHQTMLVLESGINKTYDEWGRAMTDLAGKKRPASDSDLMLRKLGYWTDAGAGYYYHYEDKLGYEGTLVHMRDEFKAKGIPIGYVQLDSWFYPKGPTADWKVNSGAGIYQYQADKTLFPDGLDGFQRQLGLPLVTHARWIDASSPLKQTFQSSGNVVIDSAFWNQTAQYLQQSGVAAFEQDWLGDMAQPDYNLTDPAAFFDNMASAMASRGLTIQYCMAMPRHYLQSTRYSNVTTIRPSEDRFERKKWDMFLYDSRLASALGLWPWVDVFMSDEADNLLMASLSAGPVGVGDRTGKLNAANLARAAMADGTLVKPDAPLAVTDETFLREAQDPKNPVVATTYSDFANGRALYVIAYTRGGDNVISFRPASLGLPGNAYVYSYLNNTGRAIAAGETFTDTLTSADRAYYVVVPHGESHIAFLGDLGHFVPLGKQRIVSIEDHGQIHATISFAPGETGRSLFGFSPEAPEVSVTAGRVGQITHNRQTGRFQFTIDPQGAAVLNVTINSPMGTPTISRPAPHPGTRSPF